MKIIEGFVNFQKKVKQQLDEKLRAKYNSRLKKANEAAQSYTEHYLETIDFLYNIATRQRGEPSLVAEFGIPYGEEGAIVEDIIATITPFLKVSLALLGVSKEVLRTRITITLLSTVLDVLEELPEGVTVTEKNATIEWLAATLFGDVIHDISVADFSVQYQVGKGRSGLAIMVPGDGWTVPDEYSGSKDDNWLTQALTANDYLDNIARLVYKELNR